MKTKATKHILGDPRGLSVTSIKQDEWTKLFADDFNHINGIENFWRQANRQVRRYNGILKRHFHLYLKGCKWRFNH